jgi:hypothetical protein
MKKCETIETKPTLVAGIAFELIFEPKITNNLFKDGHFNVYGIAPNGNKETYLPLDKSKMQALEKFVRDKNGARRMELNTKN